MMNVIPQFKKNKAAQVQCCRDFPRTLQALETEDS